MKNVNRIRHAGIAFYSILVAALLWGCDDSNSGGSSSDLECTSNDQCASRTDGKTECDTANKVCVKPAETLECTGNADCASRTDGKTECDTANKVCVKPADKPECTGNADCASRTDGKTECDTANKVCVKPADKPECTGNADCASRTDGKTECDTTNKVCVEPAPKEICGDGKIGEGEVCDGNELNNKTCADYPEFVSGTLGCSSACQYDTTACVECTETDLSLCKPDQVCTNNRCADKGEVVLCGNGDIDADEECDGKNLNGMTCAKMSDFADGELLCNKSCEFDTTACVECTNTDTSKCAIGQYCDNGSCATPVTECGNGKKEEGEDCDKNDLDGKECAGWAGFAGGTLKCNNSCNFDTSACVQCTSSDLSNCKDGQVCKDGQCKEPDYEPKCNNGIVDASKGEECDGMELNSKTCKDRGFAGGKLSCNSECKFDDTGCVECEKMADCAGKGNKTFCKQNVCVDPSTIVVPKVVISQVYPGGGNSNATYKTKYIELLNLDKNEADISGWSLQYASKDGKTISGNCAFPEDTKIPSGGYFLIAVGSGSTGAALPMEPDHDCGKFNPAAAGAKLFLVNHGEDLPTANPTDGYVDAVGYGSAKWGEGGTQAPGLSSKNNKAIFRKNGGCVDTDNNKADFEIGDPNPRDSESPKNECKPSVCNNGKLEYGEECDGTLFGDGKTTACGDWDKQYNEGNIKCSSTTCKIDYSACSYNPCGNGKLDAGEDCDGSLFKDSKMNCGDWDSQYNTGSVKCSDSCKIDYSACSFINPSTCNNGKIDGEDECDGTLFKDGKTACGDYDPQYNTGSVKCNECTIDYSGCSFVEPCGNGKLDDGEVCDGTLFSGGKTAACGDWDSQYNTGNVTCTACSIEYANCSYVKPAVCDNGEVDGDELCDGNLFKDGKSTMCAEWSDKYNSGNVSCKACEIDYSDCKYFNPDSCLEGQEWSAKYGTCVYPIVNSEDIIKIASTWNSKGRDAYPMPKKDGSNEVDDPVFLLKNDINMGNAGFSYTWTPIGTLAKPFEATFYGDNHKITVGFYKVKGLFGYTSYAKIQDFTLYNNEGTASYAQQLLAGKVDHGSIKNINVTGKWYYQSNESASGIFGDVEGATIENLTIDMDMDVALNDYSNNSASILVNKSRVATFRNVMLKGYVYSHGDHHGTLNGFASVSENDTFENCKVDMSIRFKEPYYHDYGYGRINLLVDDFKGSTIDKLNIIGAGIEKTNHTAADLIRYTYRVNGKDPIINNLEDWSNFGDNNQSTHFISEPKEVKVKNCLLAGNYSAIQYLSSFDYSNSPDYWNVVFTKMTDFPAVYKSYYLEHVYIRNDVENKNVTPNVLNANIGQLSGYLPWYVDKKDRLHLKFED